jgi:hypothetical protein
MPNHGSFGHHATFQYHQLSPTGWPTDRGRWAIAHFSGIPGLGFAAFTQLPSCRSSSIASAGASCLEPGRERERLRELI